MHQRFFPLILSGIAELDDGGEGAVVETGLGGTAGRMRNSLAGM